MRPLAHFGVILAITLGSALHGRTQQPTLRFDRLGVDDGLSQSAVNAVMQDREGFLWVGTDNGLNRYDGYGFTVYRHEPTDPTSLPHSQPQAFIQTEDGALWIGTYGGGLARFDTRTGRVTRVFRHAPDDPNALPEDRVNALAALPDGTVWIGTHGGLARLDPASGALRVWRKPDGLAGDTIRALLPARGGGLWIGTHNHGAQHLGADGRFRAIPLPPAAEISAFAEAPDGSVWIGTLGLGLFRYHPDTGAIIPFLHRPRDPFSIASDAVQALLVDRAGHLWVAAGAHLSRWDPERERFLHYRHADDDPSSIPDGPLRVVYQDRGGVLWIGSLTDGLGRHAPDRFPLYTPEEGNPLRPSSDDVGPFAEGENGAFWIGYTDGMLDWLDPDTGRYTPMRLPARPRHIVPLPDGTAWVATSGAGLYRVDPRTRRVARMAGAPALLFRILPNSDGTLWLVTYEHGLVHYDPEARRVLDEFRAAPGDPAAIPDDNLYWGERAPDGAIWVGSWGSGAARFDPRQRRVTHRFPPGNGPSGTGAGNIPSIAVLRDGTVWAATYGSGLIHLPLDGPTRRYTTADGLPDNVVYGVLEAADGRLWLPTDRGLAVFDRTTETVVAHYTRADGLQANEFNGASFLRASDGRLFVGGIGGYNHFDPEAVQAGGTVPLVFTEQTAYGAPFEGAAALHRHGTVAFAFAALDFAHPGATRYAYRLEGEDEDWTEAGDRRYASYGSLAPGRYTFRVRATTAGGATAEAAFPFELRPPWFRTGWARGLGLLLCVGLIGWLAREGPTLVQRGLARLPRKRLVSHYRLDEKLGQGGAGEVWHAVDLTAGRTGGPRDVAVKLLHEHLLDADDGSETDGRQRLRREADALASFDHPHIVQVYEGGVWNDTPYLAMELLRGETLRERLREKGPLPPAEAAALGLLLADALATVHARGIVHRDLKADNVMLAAWPSSETPSRTLLGRSRTAPQGDGTATALPEDPVLRAATAHLPYRPVLMDFGLARGGALSTLTQLGALLGTLGYMAPEQAMGLKAPDAQSDLFSFGVVLYETLTGRLPFRADNEIALLHALFNHEPEPPNALRPDVPEGLSYLVMRCLSKEPSERPVSAEAVVRALGAMGMAEA